MPASGSSGALQLSDYSRIADARGCEGAVVRWAMREIELQALALLAALAQNLHTTSRVGLRDLLLHPRIIAHLLSWNSLIVERRAPLEPEAGMAGLDVNER